MVVLPLQWPICCPASEADFDSPVPQWVLKVPTQSEGNTSNVSIREQKQQPYRRRFVFFDLAFSFSLAVIQATATGPITYCITSCMNATGNASIRKRAYQLMLCPKEKAAFRQLFENTDLYVWLTDQTIGILRPDAQSHS